MNNHLEKWIKKSQSIKKKIDNISKEEELNVKSSYFLESYNI